MKTIKIASASNRVRAVPGYMLRSEVSLSEISRLIYRWPRLFFPVCVGTLVLVSNPATADGLFGSQTRFGDNSYKITLPGAVLPAFSGQSRSDENSVGAAPVEVRKEVLFRLSFDPQAELTEYSGESSWSGGLSMDRIDFIGRDEIKMQDINQGFAYSASLEFENSSEAFDESQIVSSRQLGLHYGRLGSVNYSGLELGFRQFTDDERLDEVSDKDLWSLGVTTGRRFALTGLGETDPLWTVSLRGQFSVVESNDDKVKLDNQLWYLSPGLHWQRDSFELSADLLMPFMNGGEVEEETDYRIRAKIQKRF